MGVVCRICGGVFGQITSRHLVRHGVTFDQYRKQYPDDETLPAEARKKISQNALENPRIGFQEGHKTNNGRPAWNKGLNKQFDIRVKHLSDAMTGRTIGVAHREHMSATRKRLYADGAIERMTGSKNPMFGRIISVEEKERRYGDGFGTKISDGIKRLILGGGRWGLSGKDNPMFGRKMSEGEKILRYDEEFCRKVSVGAKASYARGQRKPCSVCFTKPEIRMMEILDSNFQDEWKYTGNRDFWITFDDGRHKNPDFVHRRKRVAIEVFGRFWHKPEEERYLIDRYKEKGWACLVVWEDEVGKQDANSIRNVVSSASERRKVVV